MSSGNRNKNKNKQVTQKEDTKQSEQETLNDLSKSMKEFEDNQNITQEQKETVKRVIDSKQLEVKNIQNKFKEAVEIADIMKKRELELDEKIKKSEEEANEYETKKLELHESIKRYDDELLEINKLRVGSFTNIIDKKVIDKYAESLDEQKELLLTEIGKLKDEQTKYLHLIANKEQEIVSSKTEISKEKLRLEADFQVKFAEKEQELEKSKREIQKQKRELQYSIEDFDDEKNYLKDKARKTVEDEIVALKDSIITLEQKNSLLIQEIEELKEIYRYLGGRDPKRLIDDLNDKMDEIYSLQGKLELSPDSLDIDELKKLRREKIDWKADLNEAYASVNDYKQRWEKEQLSIGEKETLEFQKEELTARIKLQKEALQEYKKVLEEQESKEVFSSCIKMDQDHKNIENLNHPNNYFSKQWIVTVQQKLARRKVPLYYDENVIRSFVAGLAMSRLNILQGISGTGKTSLPEAFADAIGGHFETIEVQSGWKDRQDLIGYYNTFEKKFYESDFLKALYKANTPAYRNKPFFIILDEMNLSHPEHYFADLLSLMEKTSFEQQKLKISTEEGTKPEYMIADEGYKLQIPDNVWFIGTANHDETTLQFAPKTYDRANIMEMPKSHIQVQKDDKIDLDYILTDNESFLINFSLAEEEDIRSFHNYLADNGNFKKICNKLGIGWGNRLEKQIKKFIPIFIQLGGTNADALDQIISSKILRNIQGRYDLKGSPLLNDMQTELETNFFNIFGDIPTKSIELLEQEIENQ